MRGKGVSGLSGKRNPAAARASTSKGGGAFPTTRWSLVIAAGANPTGQESREALESLCRGYWYPVYVFIRRHGSPPEQAQDLTQEFFLGVLDGAFFSRAVQSKGRFRNFLLGAVKHHLADSGDRERALKRGGGVSTLSFDFDAGESAYLREPSHGETPERIFQRKWAWAVLDRVVGDLRDEFLHHGKLDHFDRLKGYLGGSGQPRVAELAQELGVGEPALKSSIHRMRRRYRDLLRNEVAATLDNPADVDEELRFLLQAISTRTAEV
jgi:DNA-directed RNA polymerase specialized sigma24 family protein